MHAFRFLALLALLGLVATASARDENWRLSPKDVRDDVRAVVVEQLAALQREDIASAYALAAIGIRQQFRLPVYERMLRRGYAPLLKHEHADPGVVRDDGEAMAVIPVIIRDRDGKVFRFRYHLLREDGHWRVGGVLPESTTPKADA